MKEAGQSLLNGGILIIGFIILVVILTSLPGGEPENNPATIPAVTSQPVQVQPPPAASVPSAIRGARQAPPPQTATPPVGQTSSAFGQRRRRDLPQPRESAAEMENRIRNYLDK